MNTKSKINRRKIVKETKLKKIMAFISTLVILLLMGCFNTEAYYANPLSEAVENEDTKVVHIKIAKTSVEIKTENSQSESLKHELDLNEIEQSPKMIDTLSLLSEVELYYLAECVEIEAEGEGLEGKIAVANVLKNRVNSSEFPNSYKDVVSECNNNVYQFCSYSGEYWGNKKITEETYEAIRNTLNGENNVGNATYFSNLKYCSGGWFTSAEQSGVLERVTEIGQHTFFCTN